MTHGKIEDLYREFRANQQIFKVLEASKALTESIFDELPVVLIMFDDATRVLRLNIAGQRLFRTTEDAVLGGPLEDLVSEACAARVREFVARGGIARGHSTSFEDQLTASGGVRFFHWQACCVHPGQKGQSSVFAVLGYDATEERRALERVVELRKDLEMASAVQGLLLPRDSAVDYASCSLVSAYEPSAHVSGDFWWQIALPNSGVFVLVADVMGHGAGSAMVAAVLGGGLRAMVRPPELVDEAGVESLLKRLDALLRETCRGTYAVSVAGIRRLSGVGHVDCYAAAFPPMVVQRAGRPSKALMMPGEPMGLASTPFSWGHQRVEVGAGDRLYCFTDGCYEFKSQVTGNSFGMKQLVKLLDTQRDEPLSLAIASTAETLRAKRVSEYPDDDLTMVALEFR